MLITKDNFPTSIEKKIIEWFGDKLRYVGKGEFWVTFKGGQHKNPDFIAKENKRKVIEVFGDYYHTVVRKDYNIILDGYKSIGYKCLIVWGNEILNHPEIIKLKIEKFLK